MVDIIKVVPQEGPQEMFANSQADIAIFGGAAGGGKSYSLLMEAQRFPSWGKYKDFFGVIFRRTTVSIRNPGSIWDDSKKVFGPIPGAEPVEHILEWRFKATNSKIKFAHLEHEDTVLSWHSAQVPFIGFDELTEFTRKQFFYMLSRNRSMTGVKGYVRAATNPDPDSWVAEFIAWWIDQETGLPIPERAGKLRWFVQVGDDLHWANDEDLLTHKRLGIPKYNPITGDAVPLIPMSVTFVPATVYDNKKLMAADPMYLAKLMALPKVERERLLGGNWKIRASAGLFFQRSWVKIIPARPPGLILKRGWDLAATEKTAKNDPDWTSGTLLGKSSEGRIVVCDHVFDRLSPAGVDRLIVNTASQDNSGGQFCEQNLPQDPGQAGKAQVQHIGKLLGGFPFKFSPETGDKVTRFSPFSSQAEIGAVEVVEGAWNDRWFTQLEAFPDGAHDDDVDSTSRAYNSFMGRFDGIIEATQRMAAEARAKSAAKKAGDEFPSMKNGGIKMRSPPSLNDTNMIYDMKSRPIFKGEDNTFIVDELTAKALRRSGWTAEEENE